MPEMMSHLETDSQSGLYIIILIMDTVLPFEILTHFKFLSNFSPYRFHEEKKLDEKKNRARIFIKRQIIPLTYTNITH